MLDTLQDTHLEPPAPWACSRLDKKWSGRGPGPECALLCCPAAHRPRSSRRTSPWERKRTAATYRTSSGAGWGPGAWEEASCWTAAGSASAGNPPDTLSDASERRARRPSAACLASAGSYSGCGRSDRPPSRTGWSPSDIGASAPRVRSPQRSPGTRGERWSSSYSPSWRWVQHKWRYGIKCCAHSRNQATGNFNGPQGRDERVTSSPPTPCSPAAANNRKFDVTGSSHCSGQIGS